MPGRSWDTHIWIADARRARVQLGWQPATGFRAGFERFARWLTSSPERQELYRARQNANA
jgi:hypothetical protein